MLRPLALAALLLALPVLGVLGSWLALDAEGVAALRHQWATVLPGYVWTSLVLSAVRRARRRACSAVRRPPR